MKLSLNIKCVKTFYFGSQLCRLISESGWECLIKITKGQATSCRPVCPALGPAYANVLDWRNAATEQLVGELQEFVSAAGRADITHFPKLFGFVLRYVLLCIVGS